MGKVKSVVGVSISLILFTHFLMFSHVRFRLLFQLIHDSFNFDICLTLPRKMSDILLVWLYTMYIL